MCVFLIILLSSGKTLLSSRNKYQLTQFNGNGLLSHLVSQGRCFVLYSSEILTGDFLVDFSFHGIIVPVTLD